MYNITEDKDSTCYAKARHNGEKTFTLRSQDRSAPSTIAWWILCNIETAPVEKLQEALNDALLMRSFPRRKNAD